MSEIVEYTLEELKKEMELLSPLYDVVRLVNPFKCEIIDINDNCLTPYDTQLSCYDTWKCIFQCINCTSARALLTGNIQSKLDVNDDTVYHVTSRPVRVNNTLLVLETVQHFSYTYRQLEAGNTNNALISLIQNSNRKLLLDEETGAYNRYYLSEHLPYELYKAENNHQSNAAFVKITNLADTIAEYGDIASNGIVCCLYNLITHTFKDISDGELMLVRYDKDLFFILDTNLKYTDFENRINNLIAAAIPEHILFKSNKIPFEISTACINLADENINTEDELINTLNNRLNN
jgi:GGDEF domain-containing protein